MSPLQHEKEERSGYIREEKRSEREREREAVTREREREREREGETVI